MTITEMYIEAFKNKTIGTEYTRAEIIKIMSDAFGVAEGSILPSDLCYNSSNKGIEGNGKPRLFLKKGRGLYEYVGKDYDASKVNPYEFGTKPNSHDVIDVKDDVTFPYIISVLNECFGKHMKGKTAGQGWYFRHIDDEHMIWFPKLAIEKNGAIVPPPDSEWLNIISEDGTRIIEEKEDDIRSGMVDGEGALPRFVFGRTWKPRVYKFLGVFEADKERCRKGHWEFVRISTSIDLTEYQNDKKLIDSIDNFYDYSRKDEKSGSDENKALFDSDSDEGYKKEIYETCHEILYSGITEDISVEQSAEALLKAVKYNLKIQSGALVHHQQVTHFENVVKKDRKAIGKIAKQLVLSNNDEQTFNDLIKITGKKYDLIGFIFFIKDCERYLPVRSSIMDGVFTELNIPFSMSGKCSWSNYTEYITIANEIRESIKERLHRNCELLDAQSFLWTLGSESFKDYLTKGKHSKLLNKKLNRKEDAWLVQDIKEATDEVSIVEPKDAGKPVKRKQPKYVDGSRTYPRDRKISLNALALAGYKCELDESHESFIKRNSNVRYMEPHHLVPMALSDEFEYSLDREENIVSLCSNCHNQIHYGKDADKLIRTLYEKRKDKLHSIGIDIDIETLIDAY